MMEIYLILGKRKFRLKTSNFSTSISKLLILKIHMFINNNIFAEIPP